MQVEQSNYVDVDVYTLRASARSSQGGHTSKQDETSLPFLPFDDLRALGRLTLIGVQRDWQRRSEHLRHLSLHTFIDLP